MKKHEYLYKVNIFDSRNQDVLKKILAISDVKKYYKDEYIYMFRDSVKYIYIIKEGVVNLQATDNSYNDKILFMLNEGSVVNDDLLVNKETSCSAISFTDTILLRIDKEDLLELMCLNRDVMEFMLKSSTNKLTRLFRQLKNSGTTTSIDKKLCSKLWKLAKDYGVDTIDGVEINLNVNTVFLARMIGTTRETVSRSLKKLSSYDLIEVRNSRFIIKDIEKMIEYIRSED